MIREEIINIKNEALAQTMDASSFGEIEELKILYLGRQGKINNITRDLKNLKPDERKDAGLALNDAKKTIDEALKQKQLELENRDTSKRSEEHTSELQSRLHLVCRLL